MTVDKKLMVYHIEFRNDDYCECEDDDDLMTFALHL